MIPEIEQIELTIKLQEQKLVELKQQLADAVEQSEPIHHRIAKRLHSCLCTFNHTDQCNWEYEVTGNVHKWTLSSHQHWLTKADRLIIKSKELNMDPFKVIDVYQLVKNI